MAQATACIHHSDAAPSSCVELLYATAMQHHLLALQYHTAGCYYAMLAHGMEVGTTASATTPSADVQTDIEPWMDAAVQTGTEADNALASAAGVPTEADTHEKSMSEDEARSAIREHKVRKANAVANAYPVLHDKLTNLDDPMATATYLFKFILDLHDGPAPEAGHHSLDLLQDLIVLCVAEKCGCSHRQAFEDGLYTISDGLLDRRMRSRIHNAVFHCIRGQGIPCFKPIRRTRPGKRTRMRTVSSADRATAAVNEGNDEGMIPEEDVDMPEAKNAAQDGVEIYGLPEVQAPATANAHDDQPRIEGVGLGARGAVAPTLQWLEGPAEPHNENNTCVSSPCEVVEAKTVDTLDDGDDEMTTLEMTTLDDQAIKHVAVCTMRPSKKQE